MEGYALPDRDFRGASSGRVGLSGPLLGSVGVKLAILAAAGLWMLKRWALWLTIVVSVLNILSAAPGLAFAPNAVLRAAALRGTRLLGRS